MLKHPSLLIVPLFLATSGHAIAASLEALQGAWTTDLTSCDDTFKKVDGKLRFQDQASSTSTGIIVSGNKITGGNGVCTAKRVRQDKDRLTVSLSCSDAIMFTDLSVSFKMIDDQHFERFDPDFADVSAIYHRCSP